MIDLLTLDRPPHPSSRFDHKSGILAASHDQLPRKGSNPGPQGVQEGAEERATSSEAYLKSCKGKTKS